MILTTPKVRKKVKRLHHCFFVPENDRQRRSMVENRKTVILWLIRTYILDNMIR